MEPDITIAKVVYPNGCCLDTGEYIIDDMDMLFNEYLGKTIKITIEVIKTEIQS